jgi:predicted NAD-dependent protein-ADP-ribosyltransferase YbiA (DUF1768 family)
MAPKLSFGEDIKKKGYIYFYSGAKHPIERYLSTFQPARVEYKGVTFPSIEHGFQAAKFLCSNRPDLFATFSAPTAVDAKRAGGKGAFKKAGAVLDTNAWNAHSQDVMTALVKSRIRNDDVYRKILRLARKDNITLLHYEKAFGKRGAEPFWGGYFKNGAEPRVFYGKNTLGNIMMMAIR